MSRRSLSMSVHFGRLNAPRVDRTKKHLLVDIVCLSICAVIAGAEGWEDIEEFGEQKEAWLRTFLKLPHGIPSHDTIARVFRLLDSDHFEASFRDWICIVNQHLGTQHIAIDGKTLRHSYDKLSMKGMLHPENFARLRRIALNILQQDKSKGSIRRKRKRAAWNEAGLLNMLRQAI